MRKLQKIAALSIAMTISAAWAEVPHAFQSGEPALAAEVNENFSALDDRVTAIEDAVPALDDSALTDSFTERTYTDVWSQDELCDQRTTTVTDSGDGFVEITEVFRNSADDALSTAADCGEEIGPHSVRRYVISDGEQRLTERRFLNEADATTAEQTLTFDPGLLVLQEGMRNGLQVAENGRSTLAATGATSIFEDQIHFVETVYKVFHSSVEVDVNGSRESYADCVSTRQTVRAAPYYSDVESILCDGLGVAASFNFTDDRFWVIDTAQ